MLTHKDNQKYEEKRSNRDKIETTQINPLALNDLNYQIQTIKPQCLV